MRASAAVRVRSPRWNHNIQYHPLLLAAVPAGGRRALDVGCGEGTLARGLRRSIPEVAAIDLNERCIELARSLDPASEIDYLLGDFMTFPFARASFDFVVSVGALHHMDAVAALQRMRELLRPGGTLAILGLARSRSPADLPRDVAAVIVNQAYRLANNRWESPAPTVCLPTHSFREIRFLAEPIIPRARYRRHLLWRYSLIWTQSSHS